MTTLKPHLVRADTLDLQDHDTPSAKDHSRQPAHPSPYGYGPAAPHQAQTLKQAESDAYQQQLTSPTQAQAQSQERMNGSYGYSDSEDDRNDDHINPQNAANGNVYHGEDIEDGDGGDSHDEDMDDDLLDKISSSPSIEDGKYTLPVHVWPPRADSARFGAFPASLLLLPPRDLAFSPSPLSSIPHNSPLRPLEFCPPASHHGEYDTEQQEEEAQCPVSNHAAPALDMQNGGISLSESQEFRRYLLPVDDPLLEDVVEDYDYDYPYDEEEDWEDEGLFLPESSDDDTDDFQFSNDDRFVDSGGGGECFREIEDIDFEFGYALHTFVATVEGQANATKGDTMVLLEDSKSYWWLVRVVKDGSIGKLFHSGSNVRTKLS